MKYNAYGYTFEINKIQNNTTEAYAHVYDGAVLVDDGYISLKDAKRAFGYSRKADVARYVDNPTNGYHHFIRV